MKKWLCTLLILALLTAVAVAENVVAVNDAVARMGYVPMSAKNKSGISGCWYVEGESEDTLQWSDAKRIYTVTAQPDAGLWQAYAQIVGFCEWDTCSYTVGDRAQYAYNANKLNAVHSYKTLKNYVRYVGEYLERKAADFKPAPSRYVLNTDSMKFHRPDCFSIKDLKPENRKYSSDSRSALIKQGYEPCKLCEP